MYRKEIVYDRESKDYAMYLDSELVGFARTYHDAEVALDQLVFELISGEFFREAAPSETHARPAEVAEPTYVAAAPVVIPKPGFHLTRYTVTLSKPGETHTYTVKTLCDACRARTSGASSMGEVINGFCDGCGAGPSVSHFRLVEPTTPDAIHARMAEPAPEVLYADPNDDPIPDGPGEDSPGPGDPTGPHVEASPRCRACGCTEICAPDGNTIRCVACASRDIDYSAYDALPSAPLAPANDIAPMAPTHQGAGQAGATDATQPAASDLVHNDGCWACRDRQSTVEQPAAPARTYEEAADAGLFDAPITLAGTVWAPGPPPPPPAPPTTAPAPTPANAVAHIHVSAGWSRSNHDDDFQAIVVQVLAPLAHLGAYLNAEGDYLGLGRFIEIAAPQSEHVIVTRLIDELNTVVDQLPAPADSTSACMHIDGRLYSLGRSGPAIAPPITCSVCGGPHRATACPEVALVKYGVGVWEAYMEDRAAFLKLVQWATAQRLTLMGDAVAFYLSHRWGHAITGYQVLASWQQIAALA